LLFKKRNETGQHIQERGFFFLGVVEGNEKIKGSCFLFVCLVSRKSGIERGERERVEEYGSASLVYSVPLKFQQQPSALVVPYFFIIFFLDAHFDLRERESSAMLLPSSLSMTPEQDG
jgi:hypothetical protein